MKSKDPFALPGRFKLFQPLFTLLQPLAESKMQHKAEIFLMCFLLSAKIKVFYAFYLDIPSNLAVFRQPFPHSVIFWSMRGNKQHPSLSPPCPTTSPATAHRVLNDALCNWAVSRCHGKFLLCHHFGGACGNSSAEKEFTFYLNICLLLWCK